MCSKRDVIKIIKNYRYLYSSRKVCIKGIGLTRNIKMSEVVQPLWKGIERTVKEGVLYDLNISLYGINEKEINHHPKAILISSILSW